MVQNFGTTERVEGTPDAIKVYIAKKTEFEGSKRVVVTWLEYEPLELLPAPVEPGKWRDREAQQVQEELVCVYIYCVFIDFNS